MQKNDWSRYFQTLNIRRDKKVKEIDFKITASNFNGKLAVTDLQFQEGSRTTQHFPHLTEMLSQKYGDLDETAITKTVGDSWQVLGQQPTIYRNVKNRFYNFTGRGHEALAIPNVYEQRYDDPTLTTVLDLELVAKENFDFLRISSIYGTEDDSYFRPYRIDHPLNTRYSREFIVEGGKRGEVIKLMGSKGIATKNGKPLDRTARTIKIGDMEYQVKRQDFMSAPSGSFRVRIEYYSLDRENILRDTGIGFQGIAEIIQWGEGMSKI